MADQPDGPFEGIYNRAGRQRRVSRLSQSSTQTAVNRRKAYSSAGSVRSVGSVADSEADQSEIHSPTPRRHLLLQSESQPQWLRSLSPDSSFASSSNFKGFHSSGSPRLPKRKTTLSFSSLAQQNALLQPPASPAFHSVKLKSADSSIRDDSAGKRLISWMHANGMRNLVVPCAVWASVLVKWCVGLGLYSGHGTPPMFGDYEAQRHWMELTTNLPVRRWYTYDSRYWGLDYPPLTAYHSWLCGIIGTWINPLWFELDLSRGIESPESKIFMRTTALISDLLVYVPALILFVRSWHGTRSKRTQGLALLTLLFHPSLILIDSGHFQYNSMMLGFMLLAIDMFATGQDLLGAVFFVMSLCFKQMALYYAPAIGAYLFGKCLHLGYRDGIQLFIKLAVVTVLSFYVLFLPFLPPVAPFEAILDPLTRIFPFGRGLFEDKVANFWCATNVLFKWRVWASSARLVKLSALLTAIGFLPAVFSLIWGSIKTADYSSHGKPFATASKTEKTETKSAVSKPNITTPTLPLLPYALLTSSMSFFLFSFQVHEKSILLPLVPMTLLLSGAQHDDSAFQWGALTNNVAAFSMWPLLKREGLAVQYIGMLLLWNVLIGYKPLSFKSKRSLIGLLTPLAHWTMIVLHIVELIFSPPNRYPDLFAVLNVLISTPIFGLTWLWSIKRGLEVTWALGGLDL